MSVCMCVEESDNQTEKCTQFYPKKTVQTWEKYVLREIMLRSCQIKIKTTYPLRFI